MRMWMLPTETMCGKHRSGEHNEIHKHKPSFVKKHSISGRISPVVLIEPLSMKKRHDELAKTLKHSSQYEMPDLSYLPIEQREAKVDLEILRQDLHYRCIKCKELWDKQSISLVNKL